VDREGVVRALGEMDNDDARAMSDLVKKVAGP
jgi:hypothetical protein